MSSFVISTKWCGSKTSKVIGIDNEKEKVICTCNTQLNIVIEGISGYQRVV